MRKIISGILSGRERIQSRVDLFRQPDHVTLDQGGFNHTQFGNVKVTKSPPGIGDFDCSVIVWVCQNPCLLNCFHIQPLAELKKWLLCFSYARAIETPDAEADATDYPQSLDRIENYWKVSHAHSITRNLMITYCSRFNCSPTGITAAFRPGARRAIGLPSRRSSSVTKSAVPSGRPMPSACLNEMNPSS